MTSSSVPTSASPSAWYQLLLFAETWMQYAHQQGVEALTTVSWLDVLNAEKLAFQALVEIRDVDDTVLPQQRFAAEDTDTKELEALRAQVERLTAELEKAKQPKPVAKAAPTAKPKPKPLSETAATLDIRKTVGYMTAASSAPDDPVQAYRAGMVYAAELLQRRL